MNKDVVPGRKIEITKAQKRVILSPGQIEIHREGKRINSADFITGIVYLVVDCSGSMAGDNLSRAKKGAIKFAEEARTKGYSIGLIKFADSAVHLSEPLRQISMLVPIINNMTADGGTNMTDAIRLAAQKLKDTRVYSAMVIVTDGMPNNIESALHEAQDAKQRGIDIITIGTDDADQGFLKKLASRTELGIKVPAEQFEKGISLTVRMLPQSGSGKSGANNEGK